MQKIHLYVPITQLLLCMLWWTSLGRAVQCFSRRFFRGWGKRATHRACGEWRRNRLWHTKQRQTGFGVIATICCCVVCLRITSRSRMQCLPLERRKTEACKVLCAASRTQRSAGSVPSSRGVHEVHVFRRKVHSRYAQTTHACGQQQWSKTRCCVLCTSACVLCIVYPE